MTDLFGQPWWLEAAAPGRWGRAEVRRDGVVVASLPWTMERLPVPLLRVTRVGKPKFTPWLGPRLEPTEGKYATRLRRELEHLGELVDQLPPFDYYSDCFRPELMNWLPFHWRGFQCSVLYTHVLEDINDMERVWRDTSSQTRRKIRQARRTVTVDIDDDPSRLLRAIEHTFERQQLQTPFDPAQLRRLHDACRDRHAGEILTATDTRGRLHASVLIVWDDDTAYYLAGGADPELRSNNAQSLLLWTAIERASARCTRFDFEGSMIEGIARAFRGFGARQIPYLQLTGASRRVGAALAARELASNLLPG